MSRTYRDHDSGPSWRQDAERDERPAELPFLDYLQLLWYRRKVILVITLFVAVVGWVQVNEIRSLYTAGSKLLIGVPRTNVVDIEAVVSENYLGEEIGTEMEVLRSRSLAQRIVEHLGLVNVPEFNPALREPEESLFDFLRYLDPRTWLPAEFKQTLREALGRETTQDPMPPPTEEELRAQQVRTAVSILLSKLDIQEVRFSSVINVRFTSWSPELAARVANYVPEAYILDRMEARFAATEKANTWLTDQLAELETKVAESERAVEIFREEHDLDEVSGGGLLDRQMSELNSQLIVAEAELAEVDARLEQIDRLSSGNPDRIAVMNEVLSSPMIQQLRSQELDALSRRSELSLEFGPRHPRMLQVQAELSEIRERIELEIGNVKAGLENEADFARARIAKLREGIREVEAEYSDISKEAVGLRSLERDAAANRALFETFLTRFKETSSTQGMETPNARVISAADVPGGPSYPNRKRMLALYLLGGFLGGCGLVLGLHLLNPGMRGPEEIQKALGYFVMGVVPRTTGTQALYETVLARPQSLVVESINSLKFSLALSNPDIEMRAIQVTSSVPGEGKTSLALALARVEAASGKKVVVLDGDLRRSSMLRKLGLANGHKGLSDLVVAAEPDFADFVVRDEKGGLDIMPNGTAEYANAGDIFSSHRMEYIIDDLKKRYDLVIVDAPPVMAVADARLIGRLVDKTLFVVRWNKTPRKVARAALEQLERVSTDIAGIVLQQVDLARYGKFGHGESGYYYHYGRHGKYYSS